MMVMVYGVWSVLQSSATCVPDNADAGCIGKIFNPCHKIAMSIISDSQLASGIILSAFLCFDMLHMF